MPHLARGSYALSVPYLIVYRPDIKREILGTEAYLQGDKYIHRISRANQYM